MIPVLIHLTAQDDDVALVEFEVTWLLSFIAVQGLPAGQLGNILAQREEEKRGSNYLKITRVHRDALAKRDNRSLQRTIHLE